MRTFVPVDDVVSSIASAVLDTSDGDNDDATRAGLSAWKRRPASARIDCSACVCVFSVQASVPRQV